MPSLSKKQYYNLIFLDISSMKWILILLLPFFSFSQNPNNTNSLYPNENIFFKYQDEWGRNNYKKVVKEFKESPLNYQNIVFLGIYRILSLKLWN